ncbi:HigA family addiction module antitoxin [Nitrospina watsonii]|uniref:HTH cro/C1-type domain-containing protein n=1 Tax=Nitrospina watsonii TaxID=1323948 RepID=A0ABM9HGP5_9BACT|nr:HigA family addiction module antitoxin [Nitrospina watsonii]CAI2719373.1 HTH cro/C1-type domain-containing protein [Nitrospina watsonii]
MASEAKFKFEPDYAVPPGETLKETLEHLGMSQAELARRTDLTTKTINGIIRGTDSISPKTALAFEKVLNVPARFWNNLEKNYREALARIQEKEKLEQGKDWLSRFPVRDLKKLGAVPDTKNKFELYSNLLNFFGVGNHQAWQKVWLGQEASFRKSPAFKQSPESVSAWLRLGEIQAQEMNCKPFDRDAFKKSLDKIRDTLVQKPIGQIWLQLMDLCARSGVALVCIPEFNKVHLSGATHWLNSQRAIIQVSFRHKSDDQFWFTFFHEAGHILKHGKKEGFIEDGEMKGEKEKEADRFAAEYLIPSEAYQELIHGNHRTKSFIRAFAKEWNLAPGIVVGRLQHEGRLPRTHLNDLKARFGPDQIKSFMACV